MPGNVDITGYAIVSDDDKIAGADGLTPVSLRNPKDWELYQRAQELADLVVFACRSHELEPNTHKTPRLVVSREAAAGLEQRPDGWWWDPRRTTWEEVAIRVLPNGGRVAVGGGQVVFDLFLISALMGFSCRARTGSPFPADAPSFPPAIRASRPRPCSNSTASASAKRFRSILRMASK